MRVTIDTGATGAEVFVEEDRGTAGWNRVDARSFAESDDYSHTLAPGQRLVVQAGKATSTVVYDREQMAARHLSHEAAKKLNEDSTLSVSDAELAAEEDAAKRRQAAIDEAQTRVAEEQKRNAEEKAKGVGRTVGVAQTAASNVPAAAPANTQGARSSKEV